MTSLNPVLTVGRQIVEGIRAHLGDVDGGTARAGASSCSARSGMPDAARRADRTRTSSPAACASGWSSRSRWPRPGAAHRRRADDGAGRDRAGADHRPGRAAAARARHRRRLDHPRPRRRRRDRRRVLVMYGGRLRGGRRGGRAFSRPGAPVHRGLLGALPDLDARARRLVADRRAAARARSTCRPGARSGRAARSRWTRAATSERTAAPTVGRPRACALPNRARPDARATGSAR